MRVILHTHTHTQTDLLRYRRILFIGVLPLLAASSDRRATLGVLFAVLSLTGYYEARPFLRESTNVLAVLAQHATFITPASGKFTCSWPRRAAATRRFSVFVVFLE